MLLLGKSFDGNLVSPAGKELEGWFDSGMAQFNSREETGQESGFSHQRPRGAKTHLFGRESTKNPEVLKSTKLNKTKKCLVLDIRYLMNT